MDYTENEIQRHSEFGQFGPKDNHGGSFGTSDSDIPYSRPFSGGNHNHGKSSSAKQFVEQFMNEMFDPFLKNQKKHHSYADSGEPYTDTGSRPEYEPGPESRSVGPLLGPQSRQRPEPKFGEFGYKNGPRESGSGPGGHIKEGTWPHETYSANGPGPQDYDESTSYSEPEANGYKSHGPNSYNNEGPPNRHYGPPPEPRSEPGTWHNGHSENMEGSDHEKGFRSNRFASEPGPEPGPRNGPNSGPGFGSSPSGGEFNGPTRYNEDHESHIARSGSFPPSPGSHSNSESESVVGTFGRQPHSGPGYWSEPHLGPDPKSGFHSSPRHQSYNGNGAHSSPDTRSSFYQGSESEPNIHRSGSGPPPNYSGVGNRPDRDIFEGPKDGPKDLFDIGPDNDIYGPGLGAGTAAGPRHRSTAELDQNPGDSYSEFGNHDENSGPYFGPNEGPARRIPRKLGVGPGGVGNLGLGGIARMGINEFGSARRAPRKFGQNFGSNPGIALGLNNNGPRSGINNGPYFGVNAGENVEPDFAHPGFGPGSRSHHQLDPMPNPGGFGSPRHLTGLRQDFDPPHGNFRPPHRVQDQHGFGVGPSNWAKIGQNQGPNFIPRRHGNLPNLNNGPNPYLGPGPGRANNYGNQFGGHRPRPIIDQGMFPDLSMFPFAFNSLSNGGGGGGAPFWGLAGITWTNGGR